jgi:MFS family permease
VRAPTASLEPLRERPFRLLFFGRGLSAVGDAIVPVAVTFAVLKQGNATDLGIVLGAQWGARVLFLVAGGVWADRLPRQLVMMAADVLRALVQAVIAVAFFTGSVQVWQLALASALFGFASAFFNPASTGLVPSIVSAGNLQEANALLGLMRGLTDVAGPTVSGLIVATLGFGPVFAIDSASFIASFACLAAMRLPREVQRQAGRSVIGDALEGFRLVLERRWMVAGLCADVVSNLALAALFVLGPVVAKQHFNGARDWGLVLTGGAVGGLIGSAIALRYKPERPLFVGYALGGTFVLQLLGLVPPLPLPAVIIGNGTVFAAIVILNTYWTTMEQQHVPPEALSRVDSLSWVASLVVFPIGLIVVGPIAAVIGVRSTLVVASGLAALALVIALSVRDVRELRRIELPQPDESLLTGAEP